ncbi:DEAD/DEAH box helicase [Roseisalinus antarcticus]|uniref:ATP-dependent RNA helicase DeaD n=1 Tax=Roseisalinus antarcticus TaxID=254357 RepID=A0A1Y5TRA3_9RHOB|nr:DEAD/DEAH box helicase [Roseisalinus antarcticus]SLN68216.1 ATP-dependent RNA helicase DeaD [Roseisalinus antarcticus]
MIPTLSEALAERGYEQLTAVQEAVTAPELEGADLLVSAQTGSGKTVGFGLAIAPTLMDDSGKLGPAATPLALVVAPTRELALQVMRELSWLYAKAGARVTSCVGGMDMRTERRQLERGAHIVVGTPGRLRDHIQRGSLDMTGLRAVVLDEADEMLDLGFREDLEFMLGEAPGDKRTLMFSATVPPAIVTLAKTYQRDAVRVATVSGARQHADITYQALRVAQVDAENAIINVLRYHEAQSAIVFANTRAAVSRLMARFANRGFAVVSLSGELSQAERTHALQAMRDGRARVCVATDVAARGIDLPNLDLVVHAELPTNAESLLHRSGRTGRAGRKGISAMIVPPKAVSRTQRLLKFAKIDAEWTTAPSAEDVQRRDEERLLADPVWQEEVSGPEADFARRLAALYAPEQLAAAYLRLYRSRHSAPEDLSPPDTKPSPKDRKPFGPSAWISISVGRDQRAEPRWLLPMLLRAGNLSKDDIGAIRVQATETFVELTAPSAPGFMAALGQDGQLEEGIKARALDGPPDMGGSGKPPAHRPQPERPAPRPAKTWDPVDDAPPPSPPPPPAAAAAEKAVPEPARLSAPAKTQQDPPAKVRKEKWAKPKYAKPKHMAAAPRAADAPAPRVNPPNDPGKRADAPAPGGTGKPAKTKPRHGKTSSNKAAAASRGGRAGRPGKGKPGAPTGGKPKGPRPGGTEPPKRKPR